MGSALAYTGGVDSRWITDWGAQMCAPIDCVEVGAEVYWHWIPAFAGMTIGRERGFSIHSNPVVEGEGMAYG